MKRIIYPIMLLILVTAIYAATDNIAVVPNIKVRDASTYSLRDPDVLMINQLPDPVEPGRSVEVRFKVENIGLEVAHNVIFEIIPEFPFSLASGSTPAVNIGNLNVNSVGEDAVIVYYKLIVDPNATPGNNTIRFRYSIDGGNTWILPEKFHIRIQHSDATLAVASTKSTPPRIMPGENAEIDITVENMANSYIKDIAVRLDLSLSTLRTLMGATATTSSSTELLALPFAPINSATEKKIRLLESGKTHTFTYDIVVYPDAASQIYKVPIQLHYYDELGNEFTKNDVIGLVVGAKPELAIRLDSTEIYKCGSRGNIIVSFVNKGVSDIKYLDTTLSETEDYEVLSAKDVYIGNVDSDDYETVEYEVYVKSCEGKDKIVLPISYTYHDDLGTIVSDDANVDFTLYSDEHMKELGLNGKSGGATGIIITIVIVVVGLIIYRVYKKRKSEKK